MAKVQRLPQANLRSWKWTSPWQKQECIHKQAEVR
uniref:Uncharacterized protein n=1 Tax=Triticum urartu TaxID=4572 RepID=A0A8R7PM57_TRIUA